MLPGSDLTLLGEGGWGVGWGGRLISFLAPPTLSEMGFEARPASKSQDSARVWGGQDHKEGIKIGL